MFSFKTSIIVLVIILTISISIDVIGESDEFKQGKVNLFYVPICLAASMIVLIALVYLIIFIKYVWMYGV